MSGRNARRIRYPTPSILPPPGSGSSHYVRQIKARSALTGRWMTADYLATGEFPSDLEPSQPGALSVGNLVRVPVIVHDADLADWGIGEMAQTDGGDKMMETIRGQVDGRIYDQRTGKLIPAGHLRANGQPWLTDSRAFKAYLWRLRPETNQLKSRLDRHLAVVLAALKDHYGQPPTVVTSTGYGFHALYWLADGQGLATDDGPTGAAAVRRANKRAIAKMNQRAGLALFDPAACDPGTRILREIGTSNTKGSTAYKVKALILDPASRLDITTVAEPKPKPSRSAAKPPRGRSAPARGLRLVPDARRHPAHAGADLPPGYTGDVRTLDIVGFFQARDMYLGPAGDYGHYVICPWSSEHGSKAHAWIVEGGDGWPEFACKHSACAARRLRDVMHLYGAGDCMAHTSEEFRPSSSSSSSSAAGDTKAKPSTGVAEGPQAPPFARGDAVELSEQLTKEMFGDLGAHDLSAFHRYDEQSGAWLVVPDSAVRVFSRRYAGRGVKVGTDKQGEPKYRPLKLSQRDIRGVEAAAADLMARPGFFEARAPKCGFQNAVVLPTGEIQKKSPTHRMLASEVLPFDYSPIPGWPEPNPSGRGLEWVMFLGELFGEDADGSEKCALIMEFIGCAMLGVATKMQRALIFVGDGGCGKSTLREVINALFSPAARCAIAPHKMAGRFTKLPLASARLNSVPDLPVSELVDSGDLKAIISGEELTFSRKHKDSFEATPRAAHLFLANELPAVRDRSDGFWRRFALVAFNRTFWGTRDHDPRRVVRVLSELPDIAAVCIHHGVEAAIRGTYTEPASSVATRETWRRSQNHALAWVDEQTNVDPNGIRTAGKTLHANYQKWCRDSGYTPLGAYKFYAELVTHCGVERPNRREFCCSIISDTHRGAYR